MTPSDLIRHARKRAGISQSELARRAGTSQPAVNRYERGEALPSLPSLERLLAGCGQELCISSRPASEGGAVTTVRGRTGPLASRLRRHRARLIEAAKRNGARNVRVFGSVARGRDTETSDIDLLVEIEPGRTLLDLVSLRREAAEILGMPVDVATLDMLKPAVRRRALREALPL